MFILVDLISIYRIVLSCVNQLYYKSIFEAFLVFPNSRPLLVFLELSFTKTPGTAPIPRSPPLRGPGLQAAPLTLHAAP
jgi:hypothetical protein